MTAEELRNIYLQPYMDGADCWSAYAGDELFDTAYQLSEHCENFSQCFNRL